MQFIIFIAAVVLCFTGCAHKHSDTTDYKIAAESNPSGIKLLVKKALDVETKNAGTFSYFTIVATNVAPEKKFFLQCAPVFDVSKPFHKIASDEYGRLRFKFDDGRLVLSKMAIPLTNFRLGEPCTFWLVSPDFKIAVSATVIPYPLEAFAEDGAEISLALLRSNASLVRCTGRYFDKNENIELVVTSKSGTEKKSIRCENGHFSIPLESPAIKGSYGDMVTLEIHRADGKNITLSYPWGRNSFDKEFYRADISKLKEEDKEILQEALEGYYNPHITTRNKLV